MSTRHPFASQVARPAKRAAGRSKSAVPANIRLEGIQLDDDDRAYVRAKLGAKLGKFTRTIERVSVRIADVNGPRGGVDVRCRLKVVLSGLPSVVFESQALAAREAFDIALSGTAVAVQRSIQRRTTRPITSLTRRARGR